MAVLSNTSFGFLLWCEGCGHCHGIWVHTPNELTGAKWTWNGSMEKPTFSPSVLINHEIEKDGQKSRFICHTFVRDGMMEYLGDCTHELAGKTVPLEDFFK